MRTDCTIDHKQVRCPNASLLGYGRSTARVGDLLIYLESGVRHTGRMLARIAYAPNLNEENGTFNPIRNYICAVVLADRLTSVYERWINPVDVVEVYRMGDIEPREVVTGFLSEALANEARKDIACVRKAFSSGWSTLERFRKWEADLARDIAEYKARQARSEVSNNG